MPNVSKNNQTKRRVSFQMQTNRKLKPNLFAYHIWYREMNIKKRKGEMKLLLSTPLQKMDAMQRKCRTREDEMN